MNASLNIIGRVRSPLTDRASCPFWGSPECPESWIEIEPAYVEALFRMDRGQDILVLTWFHMGDRSTLQCHPQGNQDRPIRGVFTTRSPDRPNPVGLHPVRVLEIDGNRIRVWPLEAMDGTPVIDIKSNGRSLSSVQSLAHSALDVETNIIETGRLARERGLVSGRSGNISVRHGQIMTVTASGTDKGRLRSGDLCLMDIESGTRLQGPPASTESTMHMEIYRRQPEALAVLHTHPPHLLACRARADAPLERLNLYEARRALADLAFVPAMEPGTIELAQAVALEVEQHQAVFMTRHGLAVWGKNLDEALAVSDELEGLARTALLACS